MTASPTAVDAARSALAAVLHEQPWSLPADVTPDDFIAAVDRHRIHTHLATEVAHSVLEIPDEARAHIDEVDRSQRLNALRLVAELFRAREALTAAGIRSLAFKGPALGMLAWGEFTRRGFGDLDLLVAPSQVADAFAVLAEGGWQHDGQTVAPSPGFPWRYQLKTYYELSLYGPRSMIDLHWRPMPTVSAFPDFDGLWGRRATVTIAGREVATLGAFDSFVHTALHSAKDDWGYLRSLADVWQLATLPEVWTGARRDLSLVERRTLGIALRQLGVPDQPPPGAEAAVAASEDVWSHVTASQSGRTVHDQSLDQSPWLPVVRSLRPNMWRTITWADRWLLVQNTLVPHHKLNGLEGQPWWRAVPQVFWRRWQRLRFKLRARRAG